MDILCEKRKSRAGVIIALALSFFALSAAAFFFVPKPADSVPAEEPLLDDNITEVIAAPAAADTTDKAAAAAVSAKETKLPTDPYTSGMEFSFREHTFYKGPEDEYRSLIQRALENAEFRLLKDGCFVISLPSTTSYMEWTKEGGFTSDMSNDPPVSMSDGERNFDAREEYTLEAFEIKGKVEGVEAGAPVDLSHPLEGKVTSVKIRILLKDHMLNGNRDNRYFEEWTDAEYYTVNSSLDEGSASVSLGYRTEGKPVSEDSKSIYRALNLSFSCSLKYDSTYLSEGRFLDNQTYTVEEPSYEEVHDTRPLDMSLVFYSTDPVELDKKD